MSLVPLDIPGLSAIYASFRTAHCFTISAVSFADNAFMPYRESRVRMTWMQRKDSLWWSCICLKQQELGKRVVRSHAARKVRIAFVESLRKIGYASDGSRLPGPAAEEKPELFGTAQLSPNRVVLNMKPAELVQQSDLLVQAILARQLWAEQGGGSAPIYGHKLPSPPKPRKQTEKQPKRTIRRINR